MACGLPIISHDFRFGAKEIIRDFREDFSTCQELEIHKNGILVPFLDKAKFIKGMHLIASATFSREHIMKSAELYDIKNFKKKWDIILGKDLP